MTPSLQGLPRREQLSLVALDLDGTVMCPYGKAPIGRRCVEAVARLQDAGLPVTFVTGRTEDYALPIARQFGVTTPLVTYNGGRLYSPEECRTLHEATIAASRVEELLQWLDGLSEVVAVYWSAEQGLRLTQNRCSGDPGRDDYLFGSPRRIVGSLSSHRHGHMISKVIVMTPESIEADLCRRFGPDVQAVRTHPDLVEILPEGVNKGAGVRRLCRHLGVDPGRVLAVGDQENDVATFRVVGYSVAMGDAPEAVRLAAGWVTHPFADEGCARVLEAIVAAG